MAGARFGTGAGAGLVSDLLARSRRALTHEKWFVFELRPRDTAVAAEIVMIDRRSWVRVRIPAGRPAAQARVRMVEQMIV